LDGQRLQHGIEYLEVAPDRGPAVDDEHHVAKVVLAQRILCSHFRCQRGEVRLALPEVAHRFDAEITEALLTGAQHTRHFGNGAPDGVRIHPPRHATHVRELREAGQGTAAEVQAVELQLLRRVSGGRRQDQ
jgi:hypothetical protein